MKNFLFLSLVLVTTFIKAQSNHSCYNNGASSSREEIKEFPIINTPSSSLILMPYVMKEKEVLLVLKEKNNAEIISLVKRRNRYAQAQRIGILGIPSAVIGVACIVSANAGSAATNRANKQQQNFGLGLISLAPVCFGTSIYFKSQKNKNYKRAIAKYNQLYN